MFEAAAGLILGVSYLGKGGRAAFAIGRGLIVVLRVHWCVDGASRCEGRAPLGRTLILMTLLVVPALRASYLPFLLPFPSPSLLAPPPSSPPPPLLFILKSHSSVLLIFLSDQDLVIFFFFFTISFLFSH